MVGNKSKMEEKELGKKREKKEVRRRKVPRLKTRRERIKAIYLARQKRLMETEGSQHGEGVKINESKVNTNSGTDI